MLTQTIISRLVQARYYYQLAEDNFRIGRSVSSFVAANLLQDSIEIFLLAAADILNAEIKQRTAFETYLDKINEKLTPRELPYRRRLLEINRTRVLSKHEGKKPDHSELDEHLSIARSFLEDATRQIFGVEFWTVNLIDLVDEGEVKDFLKAAQVHLEGRNYKECLIECRKAFFIQIEKDYDFRHPEGFAAFFGMGKAPAYAKTDEHFNLSVGDPFDFVFRDHTRIDAELLAEGSDPTTFWNIWRLTPEVYRTEKGASWIVKDELRKAVEAEQNAAYVLETAIDHFVRKSNRGRSIKWIRANEVTFKLKSKSANVYHKADISSQVVAQLPKEFHEVAVQYGTLGFDFKSYFWKISYRLDEKYFSGYVSDQDVEFHFD